MRARARSARYSGAHLYTRLGRLEMTEARYAEATAAFDAAEALIGGTEHAEGGSQADDVTVDQWLELMLDGRANLHVMRLEPDPAWPYSSGPGPSSKPVVTRRGSRRSTACGRCSD